MIPKRIFLCGGGINVIAHVGVIRELKRRNVLQNIVEWMGVSAGALFSLCMVLGYTIDEIEMMYINFDFTNVSDIDEVPGWILNYGMDTGDKVRKFVAAMIHIKGFSDTITFQELYQKTGVSLRVFATDFNDSKMLEFSNSVTPDRGIVEAVCASMSLPYYFQPIIDSVSGHYLMDGAVISNYPLFMLSAHELGETLGVLFNTSPAPLNEIKISDFAARPLAIILSIRGQHEFKQYSAQTVYVQLGQRSSVNFEMGVDEKKELVEIGRMAVCDFFKAQRSLIKRRNSIA